MSCCTPNSTSGYPWWVPSVAPEYLLNLNPFLLSLLDPVLKHLLCKEVPSRMDIALFMSVIVYTNIQAQAEVTLGHWLGTGVCLTAYRDAIPEMLGGSACLEDTAVLLNIPALPDTLASVTILPAPLIVPIDTTATPQNNPYTWLLHLSM